MQVNVTPCQTRAMATRQDVDIAPVTFPCLDLRNKTTKQRRSVRFSQALNLHCMPHASPQLNAQIKGPKLPVFESVFQVFWEKRVKGLSLQGEARGMEVRDTSRDKAPRRPLCSQLVCRRGQEPGCGDGDDSGGRGHQSPGAPRQ